MGPVLANTFGAPKSAMGAAAGLLKCRASGERILIIMSKNYSPADDRVNSGAGWVVGHCKLSRSD